MGSVGDTKRLKELQSELLELKDSFPELKLHKTAANKSADAPFPITLSVSVTAPSSADRYDVSQLDLIITVSNKILTSPIPHDAIDVEVLNSDLPRQLCNQISKQLLTTWREQAAAAAADTSSSSSLNLQAIIQKVQQDFVQLITLVPHLLEPYQATDASGATQRRYAIVMTDESTDEVTDEVMSYNTVVTAATASIIVENASSSSSRETANSSPGGTGVSIRPHEIAINSNSKKQPMASAAPPAPLAAAGGGAGLAAAPPASRTAKLSAAAAPWSPSQAAAATAARGLPSLYNAFTGPHSSHGTSGSQQQQQQHAVQQSVDTRPSAAATTVDKARGLNTTRGRGRGRGRAVAGLPHQQQGSGQQGCGTVDGAETPATVGPRGRGRSRGGRTAGEQVMRRPPATGASQQQQQQQQYRMKSPATAAKLALPTASTADNTQPSFNQQGDNSQGVRASNKFLQQPQQQQQQQPDLAVPSHARVFPPCSSLAGGDDVAVGAGKGVGSSRSHGSGCSRGRGRGRGVGAAGRSGIMPQQQQQQQMLPGYVLAQQDLAAVQRKYGSGFRFQPPPQQPQQQVSIDLQQQGSSTATAVGIAGQSIVYASEQHNAVPDSLGPQYFSLMMKPTDPQWGTDRGALLVTGVLNPMLYPGNNNGSTATYNTSAAAGTAASDLSSTITENTPTDASGSSSESSNAPLKLTVNPSRGVPAAEIYVLQCALDEEVRREAGQAWQLRSSLRWLENYAGSTIEQCFRAQQELMGLEAAPQQQQHPYHQHQQQSSKSSRQRKQGSLSTQQAAVGQQHQRQQPQRSKLQDAAAVSSTPLGGGIKILRAAQGRQEQQQHSDAAASAGAASFDGYKLLHARRTNSSDDSSGDDEVSIDSGSYQQLDSSASAYSGHDHGHSDSSHQSSRSSQRESCSSDSEDADYSATSEDDDDRPEDEFKLHGGSLSDSAGSSSGGYALTLEGLKLDNIGVLEVVQAQLQLTCNRCDTRITLILTAEGSHRTVTSPAADSISSGSAAAAHSSKGGTSTSSSRSFGWGGGCAVCNSQLDVLLRPKFVHEGSNILAGVKCAGCSPLDLLPSVYGATCADCDAVGALRSVQVGIPAQRNCSHCHRPMSCTIPAASFIPRGPPGGLNRSKTASSIGRRDRVHRRGGGGGGVLVEGSPLPNNGACKHYRHSYRWLRFPCCGQRFACDLCHEEAVADGHDAAWATRMVCGFCSREQPLDKSCKYCGKKLATSAAQPSGRNTRFWEGGKGCRDIRMLDRRDAHKYRNSKSKTKSAKATRVGPKPWSGGAAASAQSAHNSS